MSTNPYSAPQSKLVDPTSNELINYDGKYVIVPSSVDFPDVCVKCGESGHKKQKRTMRWMNPWWYLTILISLLITIIVSLFVTKKLKITYYLCEEHLKKRTRNRIIIWSSLVFIIALLFTGIYMEDIGHPLGEGVTGLIALSAIGLFAIWLITILIIQGDFRVKKAEKTKNSEGKKQYLFHLKGLDDDFLRALELK